LFSNSIRRIPFKVQKGVGGQEVFVVQLTILVQHPQDSAAHRYVQCIVDSGASFCVFHASVADRLGIRLESGEPSVIVGVGGSRKIWLHKVRLHLLGGEVEQTVGFDRNLPVGGLLGMNGFFEHFRVTFDGAARVCELERLVKS
jgi:hypothetical protein